MYLSTSETEKFIVSEFDAIVQSIVCEYEIIPFADNVPVQIISILFKGLNIRSRKVLILRHLLPIQIVGKIREQIHYML